MIRTRGNETNYAFEVLSEVCKGKDSIDSQSAKYILTYALALEKDIANQDKQIAELQEREKIHNVLMLEGSQKIDELQEKVKTSEKREEEAHKAYEVRVSEIITLKDKLHRRNLQIADLKKDIEALKTDYNDVVDAYYKGYSGAEDAPQFKKIV